MPLSHEVDSVLLLLLLMTALPLALVSATTIDLGSLCANGTFKSCTLTNLTSSYEDPLVQTDTIPLQTLYDLTIRDSALSRIPILLLEKCPHLHTFTMDNCRVNRIWSQDLVSLANLTKLIIQRNRLYDIPEAAFTSVQHSLEELYLGYNTIHILHRKAFQDLSSLKYLDVQHNNIWSLSTGIFSELISLEHIDLSHNKIDVINAETFAKNSKLQVILLNDNPFTVFEPNSLANIAHLQQLDLRNTVLEEIQVQSVDFMSVQSSGLKRCTIAGGVLFLNASHNELKGLNVKDRHCVRHIDMHDNHLDTLDDFVGMLNLRTLDVSQNHLASLKTKLSPNFLPLPSLSNFNVAHNRIENINYDDLLLLTKISTLDVSFNGIQSLEARNFEPLKSLENFYIEGNFLNQFDFIELKRSHESLREIGLFSNPWDAKKLEAMLTFLQEHNIALPHRFEASHRNESISDRLRDAVDVPHIIAPMRSLELQHLHGVTGIHPYWTMRDILALVTLLIVLFILLLQFFRILQEEQCCLRRHRGEDDETEPLHGGHHRHSVEDNSQV